MKKFHKVLIINLIYPIRRMSSNVMCLLLLLFFFTSSCTGPANQATEKEIASWNDWKGQRLINLKAKNGFLNLAGLYWLKQGENSFGSADANNLIFPAKFPEEVGSFVLIDNQVILENKSEITIYVDSVALNRSLVFNLDSGLVKQMSWNSYMWYVIERSGHIGIRLKDLEHPLLDEEIGIEYYAFDPSWVIEASYVPYTSDKLVRFDNVLDMTYEMKIPGQLSFKKDGRYFTLEPIDSGERLFIIFSDGTSAIETYGSGRYLYADKPKDGEKTILDFNRSYNPPCAFTEFATCLLPPPENQLDVPVRAGELDFHFD